MSDEPLTLTVGNALDGREIAIISSGGHPQIPGSGKCMVCTVVSQFENV